MNRLTHLAAIAAAAVMAAAARGQAPAPADLIVVNAKVTPLDAAHPEIEALAAQGETIVAAGPAAEVLRLRGPATTVIDAGGRRLIPGLNDSHLHAVRAGRFYNLELRWDGVESLERGLAM